MALWNGAASADMLFPCLERMDEAGFEAIDILDPDLSLLAVQRGENPLQLLRVAAARLPNTPVAVIRQGTTQQQTTVTGTLADIVERSFAIKAPALIVVGDVVRLKSTLDWFLPNSLNDAAPTGLDRLTVSDDRLTASRGA